MNLTFRKDIFNKLCPLCGDDKDNAYHFYDICPINNSNRIALLQNCKLYIHEHKRTEFMNRFKHNITELYMLD